MKYLLALVVLLPFQALSETYSNTSGRFLGCVKTEALVEQAKKDNYHVDFQTVIDDFHSIVIYRHKNGSWVMVLANTHGVSCSMSFGTTWEGKEIRVPENPT